MLSVLENSRPISKNQSRNKIINEFNVIKAVEGKVNEKKAVPMRRVSEPPSPELTCQA
jgi:hypothetical protein